MMGREDFRDSGTFLLARLLGEEPGFTQEAGKVRKVNHRWTWMHIDGYDTARYISPGPPTSDRTWDFNPATMKCHA